MSRQFTFAAAGDAMLPTPGLSSADDERLDRVVERLRAADASFVNLEVLLHDFEGYPAANGPGTYMRAPPAVADDLSWAGFDLFGLATNHAMDYSHGGMEATMRALEERNLSHAGMGRTLADARAPTYLDTPAGRVALVAACSSVTTGSAAGAQRPDLHGRPGISPLAHETRYVVPERTLEALRQVHDDLGLPDVRDHMAGLGFPMVEEGADELHFLDLDAGGAVRFEAGEEYGVYRTMDEDDAAAIEDQIDHAARQADWVVASLHAHEGADGGSTDGTTAGFVESFARRCVDAGADVFVGHGAHNPHGVELYEGAPLFYDLGNFVAQTHLVTKFPAEFYERYGLGDDATPADALDARATAPDGSEQGFLDRRYWETVVPVCTFGDDGVEEVALHPVDLRMDASPGARGRPRLATGERAREILDRIERQSAPYDTTVRVADGVGYAE